MSAPFPVGTDSGDAVRKAIQTHIKTWLANTKYKTRLPRQHISILLPGETEHAGIVCRIVSQNDPQIPWVYKVGGRDVAEDWHQVAVFVKADKKAGGAQSTTAVFGALRALMASREPTAEWASRLSLGINECREVPEGITVDPGGDDAKGTFFAQQLNLRCNTDTFLN